MPRYADDGKDATQIYSEKQIKYLQSLGLNFDYSNMTDENWCNLEETVGDKLTLECLDATDDYKPNEEGELCYSILNLIPTED
jgi:hypothetical protein